MSMTFFDFIYTDGRYLISYKLPGSFTRITQLAPASYPPGYLHLYEHLVSRANLKLLAELELAGSTYNAITTVDSVSFYQLSPLEVHPAKPTDLIHCRFTPSDFDIERRTIMEERLLIPEGNPVTDKILGTADQISRFDFDILSNVRSMLKQPVEIVYSLMPDTKLNRINSDRPPILPLYRNTGNNAFTMSSEWSSLLSFFIHIVNTSSPVQVRWNEVESSKEFIRENKENLLFRYELILANLRRFDEEFGHYLRTVGLNIDLAQMFREVPWEDLLPAD